MTRERGSGSVWVLILTTGFLAMTALVLLAGGAAMSRYRAASAADLAALAAAQAAGAWPPSIDPCRRAALVAEASHVQLHSCTVDSAGNVMVQVTTHSSLGSFGTWSTHAQSRAGPGG